MLRDVKVKMNGGNVHNILSPHKWGTGRKMRRDTKVGHRIHHIGFTFLFK